MTIDERIEALTMNIELISRNQEAMQIAQAKTEAMQAKTEAMQVKTEAMQAKTEAMQAKTERSLQRWAAIGMKEARNQRRRSREIDEKITQLAAAQLVTEEKLQRFIASLTKGGNGHGGAQ